MILLVHGYNSSSKKMSKLKSHLENKGFKVIAIDLPLKFKTFHEASLVFEKKMRELIRENSDSPIHLIGHSTGGLIIRDYLSRFSMGKYLGKVILIATPNSGTPLADITKKYLPPMYYTYKTLKSLGKKQLEIEKPIDFPKIEIGSIIGDRNTLFLGRLFLPKRSDGRIEIDSAILGYERDIIILPYNHKEIYKTKEVVKYITNFIKFSKFKIT